MNVWTLFFIWVFGFGVGYLSAESARRMREDALTRAKRSGERLMQAMEANPDRWRR